MISVRQVAKSYGNAAVVEDVSFDLPEGEALVVLGPSGSGKTTLLRLLAGLELPDRGEIHLDGRLASQPGWAEPPHERGMGFVFQTSALWPHMTVAQNILFGVAGVSRADARDRLDELLARMSMTGLAGRYPPQLSGGETRRVALARALAPRPRYLLMDEPLTNLDEELKGDMLGLIQEARVQTGASLIYVTHAVEEASLISPRTLALRHGRVQE